MNRHRLSATLALFGVFVVAQGLAFGARLASTASPLVTLAQTIAVVALLAAAIFGGLTIANRKQLVGLDAVTQTAHGRVWLVARIGPTARALSEWAGTPVRMTRNVALVIDPETLIVRALPSGAPLVEIARAVIQTVEVGRVTYAGGTSDCLMLELRRDSSSVHLPLVINQDRDSAGWLVQTRSQLMDSARLLSGGA